MDTPAGKKMMEVWLPTIPMTLVDAINRCAAATGSIRYAALTGDADYNGHYVTVEFNEYLQYWVTQYTWAGRQVLCRGGLKECLRAAKEEYARGAKGCTVHATIPEDALEYAQSLGFVPYDREAEQAKKNPDDRFEVVSHAMWLQKHYGCPAIGFLIQSKNKAEFDARVSAWLVSNRTTARDRKHVDPSVHDLTEGLQ